MTIDCDGVSGVDQGQTGLNLTESLGWLIHLPSNGINNRTILLLGLEVQASSKPVNLHMRISLC